MCWSMFRVIQSYTRLYKVYTSTAHMYTYVHLTRDTNFIAEGREICSQHVGYSMIESSYKKVELEAH